MKINAVKGRFSSLAYYPVSEPPAPYTIKLSDAHFFKLGIMKTRAISTMHTPFIYLNPRIGVETSLCTVVYTITGVYVNSHVTTVLYTITHTNHIVTTGPHAQVFAEESGSGKPRKFRFIDAFC
jgi:hypothetical protein